jgi:uncharacterized protein YndB with AHSA1/START domain
MADDRITLERAYDASPTDVFALWTTKDGIESWWAPDGFVAEVQKLVLEPGGELEYTMTATSPEMVKFMTDAGMPLSTAASKTFIEIVPAERLSYSSLVDFVPGVEPYEHDTVVELQPAAEGVRAVMTIEPLHDEEWTQRLVMGRRNELENLAKLLAARAS